MLFLPPFPNQAITKGLMFNHRYNVLYDVINEYKKQGRQNELQLLERISTLGLPI